MSMRHPNLAKAHITVDGSHHHSIVLLVNKVVFAAEPRIFAGGVKLTSTIATLFPSLLMAPHGIPESKMRMLLLILQHISKVLARTFAPSILCTTLQMQKLGSA